MKRGNGSIYSSIPFIHAGKTKLKRRVEVGKLIWALGSQYGMEGKLEASEKFEVIEARE